jgi:hypothetical protein
MVRKVISVGVIHPYVDVVASRGPCQVADGHSELSPFVVGAKICSHVDFVSIFLLRERPRGVVIRKVFHVERSRDVSVAVETTGRRTCLLAAGWDSQADSCEADEDSEDDDCNPPRASKVPPPRRESGDRVLSEPTRRSRAQLDDAPIKDRCQSARDGGRRQVEPSGASNAFPATRRPGNGSWESLRSG